MSHSTFSQLIDNAGFQVSTILICVSCLYFTLVRRRGKQLHNKLFLIMLLNVVITAACNLISALTKPFIDGPGLAFQIRSTCQYIYFIIHPLLAPIFCFYVAVITGATKRLRRTNWSVYEIPMFVMLALSLINPFTGWIYNFTETYAYHRNWAVYVLYAISALYFTAAIVILLFFWEAVTHKTRHVLIFFFVIVALGTLFQLFFSPAHTELLTDALALTGVMITIENEETRRDSRTGIQNHAALAQDVRKLIKSGSDFHLICLKMKNPSTLMQLIGPANIEALTSMTTDYLASHVSRDAVYYVGPGTFVILLDNPDYNKNLAIAKKIDDRFSRPWDFLGHKNTFEAIVFFVRIPEDFKTQEEVLMLVNAPVPKGFTAQSGVCYESGLNYIMRQSLLEKSVLNGLKNMSFEVFYQPIYSARNMHICSGEALLRLHDERIGDLYPDEFLPIAERGGLIFELGDFVLEEVCKFLNSGIPVEMGIETLHINLSVVQCIQAGYAQRIMDLTSRYHIDPSRINFEIMESAAATDFNALKIFVDTLRKAGFSFSVNDYGIGYSNVHSIFMLDIGSVKIDKSILREAEQTQEGQIILESSVSMIRRMGKKIIISGIENQKQVDLAAQFGIDYLQGFFFSNPVSQNEFINVLKATKLAKIEEQKAIASNEAMTSFLANMSHEIRTPINAVLGMDEMILRESKDKKVLEYAKTIEGAGRTLLSLINDILDFSKIESGKMDIYSHSYELSSVIIDVSAMMRMRAKQKNLNFLLDINPSIPEKLVGDEMRIRQVLLNLLGNAIKYTKQGSVTLKADFEQTDNTHICLIFSIRDTGIGIREEDMDKLFEKFHRLDMEQNNTIEGSGLGLAITSQILSLMDGSIDVKSTYGKGSVFTIRLPQEVAGKEPIGNINEKTESNDMPAAARDRFIAPEVKILMVDDTPVNLIVVRELLSETGIQLDEASGGRQALDFVRDNTYDLILLDYRMPEMDGIETLHRMQEMEDNQSRDAVVVALTANAIAGARERFLREGFDDYITKPVSGKRLEEVLLLHLPDDKIKWLHEDSDLDTRQADGPKAEQEEISDIPVLPLLTDAGIDVNAGIANCGGQESFDRVFKVFLSDIPVKTRALNEAVEKGDHKRYAIEAHAIKSSARIIGAGHLSQLAQRMEAAADQNDMATVGKHHKEFVELYGSILQLAEKEQPEPVSGEDEKASMTDKIWFDGLTALEEFARGMDLKDAEFVLSSMKEYRMSEKQQRALSETEELISRLDWEETLTYLQSLKEEAENIQKDEGKQ